MSYFTAAAAFSSLFEKRGVKGAPKTKTDRPINEEEVKVLGPSFSPQVPHTHKGSIPFLLAVNTYCHHYYDQPGNESREKKA